MKKDKYEIPVVNPHRVTSPWGPRELNGVEQFHRGIDFVSQTGLRDVLAVADGEVTYDQDDYSHALRWMNKHHSAGNMIIIKHEIKDVYYYGRYLHLRENTVDKGQVIYKGQKVGEYDDVGYSFGAHLHFDLYTMSWEKINPSFIWGNRLNI